MTDFALHPRLAADTLPLGDLDLSTARIKNDRRFPWIILIPRRPDLVGLHDLAEADQPVMMAEITAMSRLLQGAFSPDRINVGALGNLVPQLHVHVLARRVGDAAWPGPVWGAGQDEPYEAGDERLATIRAAFAAAAG